MSTGCATTSARLGPEFTIASVMNPTAVKTRPNAMMVDGFTRLAMIGVTAEPTTNPSAPGSDQSRPREVRDLPRAAGTAR